MSGHEDQITVAAPGDEASAGAVARSRALVAGFSSKRAWTANIIAREIATNIWRHAGRGVVRVRVVPGGIEIEGEDSGPGLVNLPSSFEQPRPGGHGLAALQRLSDALVIEERAGGGLVVRASLSSTESK